MKTLIRLGLAAGFFLLAYCTKKATCNDGIANQGEKYTDCGGPCNACPTCFDGIQNQG